MSSTWRAAILAIIVAFAACGGPQKRGGPAKLEAPKTGGGKAQFSKGSALARMNFELKWELETRKRNFVAMTLEDDAIYALTADHSLYSIDIDEGVVNWIFTIGERLTVPPVVYRYPRDPDDTLAKIDEIYLLSGDRLRVLDKDVGEVLWQIDLPFSASSAPAGTSGRVVIGSWDDRFYAIKKDPPRGRVWHWLTEDDVRAAGVGYEPIYIGVSLDGGIYAFNQQGGEFRWKIPTRGPIVSTPVAHQGKLYVGSEDFALYCVDLTQADLEWRYETGGPITQSPVVIGDAVYVIPEDRRLVAVRRVGASRDEETDEPVAGDPFWQIQVGNANPGVKGRARVLTRGRENLYVLDELEQILAVHHALGKVLWKAPFRGIDFFATNSHDIASRDDAESARGGTIFLGMRSGWFYAIREKSEY